MNDDAAMAPVTGKPIPRVSIGMPVYNGEKFIRDALDSLLAQTFTDFELIISDNASTDDTEAICRGYAAKDARIRYVRQAENLGAAANFKFVLDEAVGEYFMWAAHDDVFFEHHLAVLVSKHKTCKYVLVSASQIHRELSTGKRFRFNKIESDIFCLSQSDAFVSYMRLHHWDVAKACLIYGLFRREYMPRLREIGARGQDVGDDLLYIYETLLIGPVCYIEDETWLRGERFFRKTPLKRSVLKISIRIAVYLVIRLFIKRDVSVMASSIRDHSKEIRSIYLSKHGRSSKFYMRSVMNELEIAGLLMPLRLWR